MGIGPGEPGAARGGGVHMDDAAASGSTAVAIEAYVARNAVGGVAGCVAGAVAIVVLGVRRALAPGLAVFDHAQAADARDGGGGTVVLAPLVTVAVLEG